MFLKLIGLSTYATHWYATSSQFAAEPLGMSWMHRVDGTSFVIGPDGHRISIRLSALCLFRFLRGERRSMRGRGTRMRPLKEYGKGVGDEDS